jgi:hypothetical protein
MSDSIDETGGDGMGVVNVCWLTFGLTVSLLTVCVVVDTADSCFVRGVDEVAAVALVDVFLTAFVTVDGAVDVDVSVTTVEGGDVVGVEVVVDDVVDALAAIVDGCNSDRFD